MYKASVELDISPGDSRVLLDTLGPEVGQDVPRTTTRVEESEGVVTLHIEAEDLTSLRAALNSYLGWMQIGVDTINEVKGGK